MEYGQIYIDPLDWFADKLHHGGLLAKIRDGWHKDVRNGAIMGAASWSERMFKLGVMRGGLDMHHIAPGWEYIFSSGLSGLIDKSRLSKQDLGANATEEQLAFYRACTALFKTYS